MRSKKDLYFKMVFVFLLGCLIGCYFETILCFFQRGYIESRRGVIYGPFNPVYGFGAVLYMLVLQKFKKFFSIFIIGACAGGVFEYFCSLIQEVVFNTISWDYSNCILNFNGRTSILHMVMWGAFAVIAMKVILPLLYKLIDKIKPKYRMIVTNTIVIFFVFDMFISGVACYRQIERMEGKEASNSFELLLDKVYPDDRLNKVFPNRQNPQTHEKIN